jgi:hypothetical protein
LLAGGVTVLVSSRVVSRLVVVSVPSVVVVVVELVQAVRKTIAVRNKNIVRMVKWFEGGKVLLHQKIKKKSYRFERSIAFISGKIKFLAVGLRQVRIGNGFSFGNGHNQRA